MIDFVYCRLKKTRSSYTKKSLLTHRKELFTGVYVSLVAISMLGLVRKTNCLRNQTKCQLSCYGNKMTLKDTTKCFSACVSITF